MVKENPYYIKENPVKVEEVRFWDYENLEIKKSPLSAKARNKVISKWGSDYVSENRGDYGPCRNSDCDCFCSAYDCICNNYTNYRGSVESGRSIRINKNTRIKGFQHLIHTGNDLADKHGGISTARGELWDGDATGYSDESFKFSSLTTSAGVNAGIGGAIASGGANYSVFGTRDSTGEARFLSASVGGEIGAGPGGVVAGYSLGADAVNIRAGGFSANVGVDVGSGVSFGLGGVEAKVGGLGFSVGKKMGISTPFGGVSVDLEESCIIQ